MTTRDQQIVNVSDAARNVTNLIKDQKTTTSGSAYDINQANQIISMLLGKATGTDQYQQLIDSILQRSAINFAPTLAEQNSSGGYNSTALQLLQNDARGRAVGESAAAVLKAQEGAANTAAQLSAAKLQTQQTKTIQAPFKVGDLLKSLGIGYAVNKGIKTGENALTKLNAKAFSKKAAKGGDLGDEISRNPFDVSSTPSGTAYGVNADVSGSVGGAGNTGGFTGGSPFGNSSLLSSNDTAELFAGIGSASEANIAALASLTDASVSNELSSFGSPFGDFSSSSAAATADAQAIAGEDVIVQPFSGMAGNAVSGEASTTIPSDVLSSESSATAAGGGASDVALGLTNLGLSIGAQSDSQLVSGASYGGLAATGALPAYITGQVATPIATNLFNDLFAGDDSIQNTGGQFFADIGTNIGTTVGSQAEDVFNTFGSSFGGFSF
jgi:hypothetical protein